MIRDYVSLLRPITLLQAIGAWIVGRMVVLVHTTTTTTTTPQELWAVVVVFLSYGVGMAANDCADADVDAASRNNASNKHHRAIASGRITRQQGWWCVGLLSGLSLWIAHARISSPSFGLWCASNLLLMVLYALGLQRILLVKNLLVGWLCISPLLGATTLESTTTAFVNRSNAVFQRKMKLLGAAGFAVGVIREVLKDVEDVDLDRGTKQTLPLLLGAKTALRGSFVALGITLGILQTPPYRSVFSCSFRGVPLYSIGWAIASAMYIRASVFERTIQRQQAWVKRMIYVLLVSLIGCMALQQQ